VTSADTAVRPRPASPEGADAESLPGEVWPRERSQRIAPLLGLCLILTAAAVVAVALARAPSAPHPTAPSAVSSAPVPSVLVVHTPTATGLPGTIEVVDSGTGRVIRTLGSAYDPYLMNGFQLSADRSTLYYTRLNEPAQTIEIVAAPLAGGPSRVVAHGIDPQLSPDGALMSYRPYGQQQTIDVMTLRTGRVVEAHLPTSDPSVDVFGSSWLPDAHQLLVTIGTTHDVCTGPPPFSCATDFATRPAPALAYLLDVGRRPAWSAAPAVRGSSEGWAALALQGPGTTSGTVLAIRSAPPAAGAAIAQTVVTVQVSTGRVLSELSLPTGASFLARDTSGTHFLLADARGTVVWSPREPGGQAVGPAAAEAAW
jgi:hypothetical protein